MSATILICDDDADIRLALSLLLSSKGYQILEAQSPKEVMINANRHQPDLILLDMNFSRDTTSGMEGLELVSQLQPMGIPVILITAWGSIELAVKGLQQGAIDFIEKPWHKEKLLKSIEQQLAMRQLSDENTGLRQLLTPDSPLPWVAESASMRQIEQLLLQVAPTDANILILGENGSGKSLLAKRIHQLSSRCNAPLIEVNMAAIPVNLFESELFGHQKGAFTDAKESRVGRFQLANDGSLFLDEIGTMPLELQPKLLRVLETGQFEVLGSSQTQVSRARIISATNAKLSELVSEGRFRQDLLYRLNTFVITLPPLRERQQDIILLAQSFVTSYCQKYHKGTLSLSGDAQSLLLSHAWPGNVRELQHVIERAVLLCTSEVINAPQILIDQQGGVVPVAQYNDNGSLSISDSEVALINKALLAANGQVAAAAELLGISRNSLYRRLEKHGISHES
ncbi:MAG: sigma-54-dependent Fis family transcriptional regulator [Psychrobium sp.]|nr:sigma-54-dependent Fis family transcriptional regulator [Psychrobium sp.]